MTADRLLIATGGNGSGTMTVVGPSTQVNLTGPNGRLTVGNWGEAWLTVSGGAKLDAATASCIDLCFSYVGGNSAGTFATLDVTGAGSEVKTRGLVVGSSGVFTNPPSSFNLGTPGGTTDAFVNISAGAKLSTEVTVVGWNTGTPDGTGAERANGTVVIDGAGSQWTIGPHSFDNTAATLIVGRASGGTGAITISNGGKLLVDGTGGPGPNDVLNIGVNGGVGTLTVTGGGSSVDLVGINTVLQVGRSGPAPAPSDPPKVNGTFEVLAGATASALYLNIGRDGATGMVVIDGAGSQLSQVGVGTNQSPGANGPAFANVGPNGGSGTVIVRNGGQWIISDGGGDGRTSQRSPGIALGRGANSTGSLTITGAGSKVEISSTSLNPEAGTGDNFNPFFGVGYDNPATTSGTLLISDGGKLIMTGNALSTLANGRATTLNIGGRNGTAATGTATVIGAGSEIRMTGYDTLINVGREDGGTGTLNVLDKAEVSAISLAVGIGTTGAALGPNKARGTVNIDDAKIVLGGARTDASQVGAGTAIGRGTNGVGVLNMLNGAQLQINPTALAGGMSVGGDRFLAGGTGTVALSGGSSIVFGGAANGNRMTIGHTGSGTMTLTGASLVDVGASGETTVGRFPGGVGTLTVSGGSTFRTGIFGVGGADESVAGGTGTATFSGPGTLLDVNGATGLAIVGSGGNGNLSVTNQATLQGTVLAVGVGATGTGTVTLNHATVNLAGQANDPDIAVAGAGLYVGGFSGRGTVNIENGTQVTITNTGNLGANLSVGGFDSSGNGTLDVSGGSQIKLNAAPGLANARIGHNGSGTATFSSGSLLDVGSGNVFIAAQPGSVGTLVLNGGSSVNAGFVGVGVSSAGIGKNLGAPGGTGTLDLGEVGSEGTINAPRFELGVGSTLMGSGTINAGPDGEVVIGGTIAPGRSPGRIRIYCDVTMLFGSQLILEVDGTGAELQIDQLVIGNDSTFDLTDLQIVFAFVGGTNPEDVTLNLNEFLRTSNPDGSDEDSLAALFGEGQNWGNVVNSSLFAFTSSAYDVTSYRFNPATGRITGIRANPVPEPATFALVLLALALLTHYRRRAAVRR